MKIFIKQDSGDFIGLTIEPDTLILDIANMLFNSKKKSEGNLEAYLNSISLFYCDNDLNLQKTIGFYKIDEGCVLEEKPAPTILNNTAHISSLFKRIERRVLFSNQMSEAWEKTTTTMSSSNTIYTRYSNLSGNKQYKYIAMARFI